MITYQDLLALNGNEDKLKTFIPRAVSEYKNSDWYKFAQIAEKEYQNKNVKINSYEKIVYDLLGTAHKDVWSPNNKIAIGFYQFTVDQEISYLLRNGIQLKPETLEKLGKKFYKTICSIATYARVHGKGYGLWDYDKLVHFKATEFVPLYDEETGKLAAGIRFWQLDKNKPVRYTLFEPEGYTKIINDNGDIQIIDGKVRRKYKNIKTKSEYDGEHIEEYENYGVLPVVEMKNGDDGESSLAGKLNTLDSVDKTVSELMNNVDDGNIVYWTLVNTGMTEMDAAEFVSNLKKSHVAKLNDENAKIDPHTVEAPVNASIAAIDKLKEQAHDDFMTFDYRTISAGGQTATAIKSAFSQLDSKCDKIEDMVTDFITDILEIAGIDDTPTYTRSRIMNEMEEIQKLMLVTNNLPEEYIQKKMIAVLGDSDKEEEILDMWAEEQMRRIEDADAGTDDDEQGSVLSVLDELIEELSK